MKLRPLVPFATLVALVALAACDKSTANPDENTGGGEEEGPELTGPIASVYGAMDTSADPCQDFYQYACGGWLATNEIPADKPMYSRLSGVNEATELELKAIMEEAAANPGDDANKNKMGDFYASCMDQDARNAAGIEPLKPAFEQIAKVKNLQTALETSAKLGPYGVDGYMSAFVGPDAKDPNTNLLNLYQGGLGLPTRDFYLRDDPQSKQLLAMYEQHITSMLTIAGDSPEDAAKWAKEIVALETKLAEVSLPLEELRDAEKTYNKVDMKGLSKLSSKIKWKPLFKAAGLPEIKAVNAATPEFISKSSAILAGADKKLLQAHLRFQLVSGAAGSLNDDIANKAFEFSSILTGQQKRPEPWKRCVSATGSALPELVGPYYVEVAFPGDSKAKAMAMIQSVESAFETNLDTLPWMTDATRTAAQAKAGAIVNKIGYPDSWRDYSSVAVDRGNYFASRLSASEVELARQLAKAGQPVDKTEWFMAPFILNAYANPSGMEMVFPAGILQPPLFSTELPMAVNFGAIGSIMGHELTHHFDDQGRKFDASGAMESWWEPQVITDFEAKASCVVDAYGAYEALPGMNVNGQQTLGENIADIGGLKAAHAAYMKWAEQNPEQSPIPGLDNEQLLFVAYAQNWCQKISPEMEKVRIMSDVHSPGRFRAAGALSHNPEFWEAFSCDVGTPMHPQTACEVW